MKLLQPHNQNILDRPPDPVTCTVTNVSNGLPSDHADNTGRGTMENTVANVSNSLPPDREVTIATSVSEPSTHLEGGTLESPLDHKILSQPSDPVAHANTNVSKSPQSHHEDVTTASVSEPPTLLDQGTTESPPDQTILGQAADPSPNPSSNISSNHAGITGASESDTPKSDHAIEEGTPASGDVDFFGDYSEGSRYRIDEVIGKGSHGVVCSAYDTHLGEKVAIKKISDIFKRVSDATRILREIKLLRRLHHPDIVEIKHILLPPSKEEFKDMYVVLGLMECDLRTIIKANDDLSAEHCRFFIYQLLRGLKYIHSANVFHRDLNPKNILAIADCKLKIRHFSHAFINTPTAIFWTDYVAARWYKAPELCGQFFSKYSPAIDIWSIGCIFAELLTGKPLFPGENAAHQLDLITDLLGTPSPESIAKVRNEKVRISLSRMQKKRPIPFSKKFPKADPLALCLLERMLAFDPEHRPSAKEALADPYFKALARVEREPSAKPVPEAEFEFERLNVTKEDLRELIYQEILEYHHQHPHPQLLKKEYFEGEEPQPIPGYSSFARRRQLLAKVTSIAPKMLHHHPDHLHYHPNHPS